MPDATHGISPSITTCHASNKISVPLTWPCLQAAAATCKQARHACIKPAASAQMLTMNPKCMILASQPAHPTHTPSATQASPALHATQRWETYRGCPGVRVPQPQAAMKSTLKEQMQACCLVTFCSAELPHVTAPHRGARPSTDTDSLPVPHTGLNSDAHDADRQVFVAVRITSVTKPTIIQHMAQMH